MKIFDTKNVILLKINETDLNSFLVDSDLDDQGKSCYQLDELSKVIINTIPEYVYANYENPEIPQTECIEKLRQAAKSIYKIKDFDLMRRWYLDGDQSAFDELEQSSSRNRGEFGELILHMLLRDFKSTIPLISKVYFKDSSGVPAHGFDAVHVSPNEKILWLGESKFYSDSKEGIRDLLKDLNDHFKKDYLEEQFTIIKKNLDSNNIPERDEWIKTLNNCTFLKDRIKIINIPLLCIYPHDIYKLYDDLQCDGAINCHEVNIRELKKYFDANNHHPHKSKLNIILMLFPVKDKKELVKKLHERLWHMQSM